MFMIIKLYGDRKKFNIFQRIFYRLTYRWHYDYYDNHGLSYGEKLVKLFEENHLKFSYRDSTTKYDKPEYYFDRVYFHYDFTFYNEESFMAAKLLM